MARTWSIHIFRPLRRRGGSRPLGAWSAGARHEPRARRRAASVRATRAHKSHALAVSCGLSMAASGADCQSAGRRRNGVDHAGWPISYLRARPPPENLGLRPRPSQLLGFWLDRRRQRLSTVQLDQLERQPTTAHRLFNQNPGSCQSFRVEIHALPKGLRSSWIGKALSVYGCTSDGLVQGSAPVDFDGATQSDSRRNLSVQLHLPSEGCR